MIALIVMLFLLGSLSPVDAQQAAPIDSTYPPASSSAAPAASDLSTSQNQSPAGTGSTAPAPGASALASRPYPGSRDPQELLGLTLAEAFSDFGAPEQVFALRGDQPWQDDVVFYYPDHSYLFWFKDRVWQIRVDRRFAQSALGVTIGESTAEVERVLGTPFHSDGDSLIFLLPDRGFPVRARLFFEADRLVDLYVYRGDF